MSDIDIASTERQLGELSERDYLSEVARRIFGLTPTERLAIMIGIGHNRETAIKCGISTENFEQLIITNRPAAVIAKVLAMPESTAESHLTRALQKLTGCNDPRRRIGNLNTHDGMRRLMMVLSKSVTLGSKR